MFDKTKKDPVSVPATAKESYAYTYRMSYEEALDAFTNLASRWKPKTRKIISIAVALIAIVFLIIFLVDNTRVNYFFVAVIAVFTLALIVYIPYLQAKRGAAKVRKTGGTYKVELLNSGHIKLPNGQSVELKGDKAARSVETDRVFAIRADSANTFCIPKRVIKAQDIDDIRSILQAYTKFDDRQDANNRRQ